MMQVDWKRACDEMASAGFNTVQSYNPYWDNVGNTFEDIDSYRIVLQNAAWKL